MEQYISIFLSILVILCVFTFIILFLTEINLITNSEYISAIYSKEIWNVFVARTRSYYVQQISENFIKNSIARGLL